MQVNRLEFIQQLVDKHGYTKKSATALVDDFIDMILENYEQGNSVAFHGFGKFEISERQARVRHNPHTGGQVDIPAHFVPKFIAGNHTKFAIKKWEASRTHR